MNRKKSFFGFTLIEMIVTLGILGILFAVGTNIFSYILKGSDKANVLTEINQNGAYVLDSIVRTVRSSPLIKDCSGNTKLEVWDQNQTSYSVIRTSTGNFSKITGNGCSVGDPDCYLVNYAELLTSCNPQNGSCDNPSKLSNTHPLNGANVNSLTFTCSPASNPSVVTVNLILKQGAAKQSNEAETQVPFKTSVEIRNF